MDKRFIEMLGQDIVNIAEEWKQLSADDLQELKDEKATEVFCVYENWKEFTEYYIRIDISEYLIDCIDIDKATEKVKTMLSNDYTELSSGRIVQWQ